MTHPQQQYFLLSLFQFPTYLVTCVPVSNQLDLLLSRIQHWWMVYKFPDFDEKLFAVQFLLIFFIKLNTKLFLVLHIKPKHITQMWPLYNKGGFDKITYKTKKNINDALQKRMLFYVTILQCKAILGRGQPGLMRWILLWIMPLVQAQVGCKGVYIAIYKIIFKWNLKRLLYCLLFHPRNLQQ